MSALADIKSKGIILRSKEQETEEGEKCTRYFFKKIISKGMVIEQLRFGRSATTTQQINETVKEFYKELYKEKPVCRDTMKEVLNLIDKTVKDHVLLTQDFTIPELTKCISSFKKGKSPGLDGLPLEFYSTFWDIVLTYCF